MTVLESEQFLHDLEQVHTTLGLHHASSSHFLSDLEWVHGQLGYREVFVPDETATSLCFLEILFKTSREKAIKQLGGQKWWETLPSTDPLLCPVSLFGTLDLGLRETAHTRTLGWLLDPGGNHGFGSILLRSFLEDLFMSIEIRELSDIVVRSESLQGERRDRLDICMTGNWVLAGNQSEKWLVVVEAKIDAEEGDDQCGRYEAHCREEIEAADQSRLVFLTPDNRAPSTASEEVWSRLTFLRLMKIFRRQLPALEGAPGLSFLRLYMTGVLKDIYGLKCGMLSEADDHYRAAEYLSLEITAEK